MSITADRLEINGELLEISHSKSFVLNNNQDVWWVKTGAVDIFAASYKNKKLIASREYLCRVKANELIFGFGNNSQDAQIKLIAVGIPGTEVVQLSQQQLLALLMDETDTKQLANWTQKWLTSLISSLTVVDNSISLQGFDPLNSIQQNKLLLQLADFHQTVITSVIAAHKIGMSTQIARLQHRMDVEQQAFDRALRRLATTVKTDERDELLKNETGEALFDACQLVTQAMGIRISRQAHHLVNIKATQQTNELTFEQIVKDARLTHREVALTTQNWWREDSGPLLAFIKKDNRPVALLPTSPGNYVLVDPSKNTRIKVTAKVAATLASNAIMLFRTFPAQAISLSDLVRFGMTGNLKDIFRLLLMGIFGGVLSIAIPFATGVLFNSVIPGQEYNQLLQIILLLFIVTIAMGVFEVVRSFALLRIEGKVNTSTQAAIIDRLFSLPMPFFRRYSSGDLAQRAFATDNILQLITGSTQTAILTGVFSLFSWAYMFFINISLAVLATGLVMFALVVFTTLNYWRLQYERRFSTLQGVVINRVFQLLNGIAKLRIAGAEIKAFVLWTKDFGKKIRVMFKAQQIANYLTVFNAVFMVIALLVIFGAVAYLHITIRVGSFLAFNAAFIQFAVAILAMSDALTSALNAVPLYERAKPILHTLPEVDESKALTGELKGNIEISGLMFRYHPNEPLILEDISLQVKAGEFVAFVGPSSSGKTTLFRLLLGLERPEAGAIYFDNSDLAELNVKELRRQIGVVIQNAQLLPGNIFTNIVGSSSATLEDAWEAARLAGIAANIEAMPMGMHTVISEGAGTISGGQRQRILIARAIVNKPKILLFDEASSAVDNLTQATISESLAELKATRLVIAHRLSTVIAANKIFVIDKGKIVESGTYEELMNLQGRFMELAKRQLIE